MMAKNRTLVQSQHVRYVVIISNLEHIAIGVVDSIGVQKPILSLFNIYV